jgi:serine/threonine protein kinase
MARIYIARSTGIGSFERHVVLKLITPERANEAVAVQMFLDEARLAASLNHQNVAQVFEVGEDGGIHYLAMEYVHGQDLRTLLAKAGSQGTRVPLELALTVVAGAAAGLNHAHERRGPDGTPLGIVHRDVSPSNLMVGYDGAVKLLDFGIAKAAARSVETQSGIIKGKFAYMAPEQCRGRDVDRRSDVFSLGIILYEITTQHRCFRADSDFDTMHRIVTGDVVRPARLIQGYPQPLEAIVMKALAVDAGQRYQSAGLLLEALEAYAVSARMSLSTMALGRFMRDMFGEQPEPWLTNTGRIPSPTPQKESTISNTSSTGGRVSAHQLPIPDSSPVTPVGRTVLELPRSRGEEHEAELEREDPNVGEWNPRSYPTSPPAYASAATLPPGSDARASLPPHVMAAAAASLGGGPAPLAPPVEVPAGTQSIPPGSAQPISASSTAAVTAVNAPAMSATRHGYPSAKGLSHPDLQYPLYEPSSTEVSEEVRLKPNRRPYVIGAAAVLIVLAVVIAMTIGGSGGTVDPARSPGPAPDPDLRQAPVEVSGETPVGPSPTPPPAVAVAAAAAGSDSVPEAQPPFDEDTISIRVVSEPPGADVLLAGKPIGTTPLDTRLPKGAGPAFLTVRRSKFHEVTTRIDLAGDFTKEVTLKPIDDQADDRKKADEERKRLDAKRLEEQRRLTEQKRQDELRKQQELKRQQEAKRQEEQKRQDELKKQQDAKRPRCQDPGRINPFDTNCLGLPTATNANGACPPCKEFK